MNFCLFYHSLVSDWNHGNAHFLRGVVRELKRRGHGVRVFEPRDGWSRRQLVLHEGARALRDFASHNPDLESIEYGDELELDRGLAEADVVIVHEWNDPALVAKIGRHRRRTNGYKLLFHDTHHRSASAPDQMAKYDLGDYDGVLAFGGVIRDIYRERGWAEQVWVWHEAADTTRFHPQRERERSTVGDVVWVGNWGDDERTAEIEEFLFRPVASLRARTNVFGVRYPRGAIAHMRRGGIRYRGWLANHHVPRVFRRHCATIHIPRQFYRTHLPGIPTIRPFEALACGIPLVSAPWEDLDGLFRRDVDYLVARHGDEMTEILRTLLNEPLLAMRLAHNGWETIARNHTCGHRAAELLGICRQLGAAHAEPPLTTTREDAS
jgi:spore maturation protein CgeB